MKKRLLPLCLIMAAAVGLTACSGSQQGSEEVATEAAGETGQEAENGADEAEPAENSSSSDSEKTDIVIAAATEAVTLDPQGGWDGASLYVLRQLYNGLVKLDSNLEVVGDLAESWEFTSDTSVTFKLKQGVKFHNPRIPPATISSATSCALSTGTVRMPMVAFQRFC